MERNMAYELHHPQPQRPSTEQTHVPPVYEVVKVWRITIVVDHVYRYTCTTNMWTIVYNTAYTRVKYLNAERGMDDTARRKVYIQQGMYR